MEKGMRPDKEMAITGVYPGMHDKVPHSGSGGNFRAGHLEEHKMADFGCDDHADMVPHHKHMDGQHHNNKHLPDHERGVGHPAHHTHGKMPSQLNPDHGPHHMSHEHHHRGHHPGHPVHLKKSHPHVGHHHGRGRG